MTVYIPVTKLKDICQGDLVITPITFNITWKGQQVRFAKLGFLLVHYMAERAGRVIERADFYHAVWEEYMDKEIPEGGRALDTAIKCIRRKFEVVDPKFDQIQTVYQVGYSWKL